MSRQEGPGARARADPPAMSAAGIARSLGGAHRGANGRWLCRCPIHQDRTPSLSLRDGESRLLVKCFAGCDAGDILAELRRRGLLGERSRERPIAAAAPRERPTGDDTARRIALARWIWDAAGDARGSPVVAYFFARGITIAPPPVLRWAPALRRPDGTRGPAMVARIDDVTGRMVGVHRTWLARDAAGIWRRRDRAMLGPIRGGAVRLAKPRSDAPLLIAEGIETALAAMVATGLPGWAALSAGGIARLILPAEVREVVIVADNDPSGTGERAARTAAARWLGEGRRVRIALPPEPGSDIADVLAGRGAEARHAA